MIDPEASATTTIEEVKAAYEILIHKERRAVYDSKNVELLVVPACDALAKSN